MDFFKEERAVLTAVFKTLKLGFTMVSGKKTTSLPRSSTKNIAATSEKHFKADGNKPSPKKHTTRRTTEARGLSSLHSSLYKNGVMTPFGSLFDRALLTSRAEDLERPATASIFPEPQADPPNTLNTVFYNGDAMEPFHTMFGPGLSQDDFESPESYTADYNSSVDSHGRISPTLSLYDSHISFSTSDSLCHTRRSSWATSISSSQDEAEASKFSTEYINVVAELEEDTEEPPVLFEYQHYHQLITVESPDLYSNISDYSASVSDYSQDTSEITDESENEILQKASTEEVAPEIPQLEYHELDEAAPVEEDAVIWSTEETTSPAEESFVGDESSLYEEDSNASPPASPEEAVAWAHSHCPTNPEGTKVKILKDQHGQEYVLYHDCFHCLPKKLAPEFADEGDEDMECNIEDTTHTTEAEVIAIYEDDTDTDHELSHSQRQKLPYADASDLCRGPWMLYKYEENDWYMRAFRNYFEEWQPLSFLTSRRPLPGKSPLSQIDCVDDMDYDQASPVVEAVVVELKNTPPTDEPRALEAQKFQKEEILGPCGHIITVGNVSSEQMAIKKFTGCGVHRLNGLLGDCRLAAVEEFRADGSFVAGGDLRAKSVTDWVKTGWPAFWGAEVRLVEADGKRWFLDTGETAVPCEYRGQRRSSFGFWEEDDEE